MTTITSDTVLSDIDRSFKISAGPGAGKTYWLVNHIKNVLHNSNKLYKTKRIGCITYTNIAVETIINRLNYCYDNIFVSTIHSFLYQNIVKPYISFIPTEYGLDISNVDGHDEIVTSFKKVKDWLEEHPKKDELKHPFTLNQLTKLPDNKNALINWLESVSYKIDGSNNIYINADNRKAYAYSDKGNRVGINYKTLETLKSDLIGYKKQYWENGKLSHDDVLFFSYILLQQHPYIANIISEKYPYLFFDEFQDINPIQLEILKKLSSLNIVIGIIGDVNQSIYSFQGAIPEQFVNFRTENMDEYILKENRRSSTEIINFLNKIRTDIKQEDVRNEKISNPKLIIGDPIKALRKAKTILGNDDIVSLSRDNITSNILKKEFDKKSINRQLLIIFKNIDSNYKRYNIVITGITTLALANAGKIRDAIRITETYYSYVHNKNKRQKLALNYLYCIYAKFYNNTEVTLTEFVSFLRTKMKKDISNFKAGKIKDFYDSHTVEELMLCINIPEDKSQHKTIHKAKGDEFNNVLLVLKSFDDLKFIFNSNLNSNEEHRINYVGVSRAKDNLFINVPNLDDNTERKIISYLEILKD